MAHLWVGEAPNVWIRVELEFSPTAVGHESEIEGDSVGYNPIGFELGARSIPGSRGVVCLIL